MKKVTATDPYTHQKKYAAKMLAEDCRRVTVWVPTAYTGKLQQIAEEMRKAAAK